MQKPGLMDDNTGYQALTVVKNPVSLVFMHPGRSGFKIKDCFQSEGDICGKIEKKRGREF